MSQRDRDRQLSEALHVARGFMFHQAHARPGGVEAIRESLETVDKALSLLLWMTGQHDAGAYARCSFCGRYSVDSRSLLTNTFPCDCGQTQGWSGSFVRPGPDAKWSIGVNRP